MGYPTSTDLKFSYYFTLFMTVLMKFQIKIRFSIELHGNSKLSMTSCPPSSGLTIRVVLPFILYAKQWRMKKRMRTAELVKIRRMIRGCAVWVNDSYRVMPYKSHICTGWCRSYKVESNKWFFISFLFCNTSYMFTWEKINDK